MLRLTDDQLDQLREIAEEQGEPAAVVAYRVLRDWLRRRKRASKG